MDSLEDLSQLGQTGGVRALTAAAVKLGRPLQPVFQAYTGSMFVSGLVAPPDWFLSVTKKGWEQELTVEVRRSMKRKTEDEQRSHFRVVNEPFRESYETASDCETPSATAAVELTLVDASVLPAVGTDGTRSAGHTLPVLRVPISSINAWWFVNGDAIKGSSGWAGSFGMLFPIDL